MLASRWARAGDTVDSRRTRSAADARSAARRACAVPTWAGLTPVRPGAGRGRGRTGRRPDGDGDADVPGRHDQPGFEPREMLFVLGEQGRCVRRVVPRGSGPPAGPSGTGRSGFPPPR